MKLTRMEALPANANRSTKNEVKRILDKFAVSGFEIARVDDYPHKSANICATAFRNAARRYHNDVTVAVRKAEVFLVRTKG